MFKKTKSAQQLEDKKLKLARKNKEIESEDKFGDDQEITKSTYLDFSNTDAELIQLILDDEEFENLDKSTTASTPTPPGPSSYPSSPTDIFPRIIQGTHVPSCIDWPV